MGEASRVLRSLVRLYSAGRSTHRRPRPRSSGGADAAAVQSSSNQLAPKQAQQGSWTEVADKRSGAVYYWNKGTGETTAVGEPRPGPAGRQLVQPVVSRSASLGGLLAMGAGVGLVFGVLGRLF